MPPQPLDHDLVLIRADKPTWADRHLFFVIFVGGALLTVVLKKLGVGQAWVTSVPVTSMLLYALYVSRSPRYRLRADQAGDSLYYLGFLYTMASLAYSLYEFRSDRGTEAVVTNFGIALITTILGLTFRVMFQQMRDEPFDVEREVQADLGEAALRLRNQVLAATGDFERLRTAVTQTINETMSVTAGKTVEAIAAATSSFGGTLSSLVDTIRESGDALRTHQATMRTSLKRAEGAVERLSERLDRLDVPADLLKKRLDLLTVSFEALVKALEQRTSKERADGESLAELRRSAQVVAEALKVEIAALSASTASHRTGVESALLVLREGSESLKTMAASGIKDSMETARVQRQIHEELLKSSQESLTTVRELRDELASSAKASGDMLGKVHASLVSAARLIVEELNGKRNRA